MKIQRILVPIDGSEGAQAALDAALDLQPGHPAEILVVLALEPIHLRIGAQITQRGENVRMIADEQRLIAEDRLAQLESDLRGRGVAVRTFLGTGPADDVILSAAKKPGEARSSGSQFFITTDAAHHLNGEHVVFGAVVEGMDVVSQIVAGAVDPQSPGGDRPLEPVSIDAVEVVE